MSCIVETEGHCPDRDTNKKWIVRLNPDRICDPWLCQALCMLGCSEIALQKFSKSVKLLLPTPGTVANVPNSVESPQS